MLRIKFVEKTKVHILCSVTFSPKSCPWLDNVEKYGGSREAADSNVAANCMLDN
jgi:hypothetical protein